MENASIFVIMVSAILVNNFVLSRFLGICPFLGVSKQVETAFGMGMAVTFVITIAGTLTYFVHYYLLVPLELEYLQTAAFILSNCIACTIC
jgi:Na+-translocating ferredoxin:NAD+ oxidoreductase subunit A